MDTEDKTKSHLTDRDVFVIWSLLRETIKAFLFVLNSTLTQVQCKHILVISTKNETERERESKVNIYICNVF